MSARPPAGRVAWLGAALAAGGAWQALLILVLIAAVLWADEATRALARTAGAVWERARRRRELDLRQMELQAALYRQGQALSGPAPCPHRQAVPVPGIGGNVVAWLCPQCDAQLPQDFSVLEENP